jgi:phosphoribosylglycinamide formyltransferase-1
MKNIVILTGSELRHEFFRKYIAQSKGIHVINTYCEGREKSLRAMISIERPGNLWRSKHLSAREQSEVDSFGLFVEVTVDNSNPVFLPKGDINSPRYFNEIIESKPDLLIAYGCSIIKDPLLSAFKGRFLNVHLGLSPYYRGAGTNYWPLVNGEPEYVGATFMHIAASVDAGEIIHQIRGKFCWGDSPSQIGNRLIVDMGRTYKNIVINFDNLVQMRQLPTPRNPKFYKAVNYTEASVTKLYDNFEAGLIEQYMFEDAERRAKVPIIVNPAVKDEL